MSTDLDMSQINVRLALNHLGGSVHAVVWGCPWVLLHHSGCAAVPVYTWESTSSLKAVVHHGQSDTICVSEMEWLVANLVRAMVVYYTVIVGRTSLQG